MSAGTGVYHSEFNYGNEELRLLQIWILPDKSGHKPNYGEHKLNWNDRINNWLQIVSSKNGSGPVKVNQDINIYVTYLEKNNEIPFKVDKDRQAYLVQIEGNSIINNVELSEKDALEIVEENIKIRAKENSHFLIIEMKKI